MKRDKGRDRETEIQRKSDAQRETVTERDGD